MIHQQAGTSFLSPHAQLTFNPAHQTQSCLSVTSPRPGTFDSPTVTGATSSVFYSAVNTLLDMDTVGDEHMECDDIDSSYSSFDSSSLATQMPYTTPPSALNRSFSLPPQLQGRYGMSSSRYYSSSDYVSVIKLVH